MLRMKAALVATLALTWGAAACAHGRPLAEPGAEANAARENTTVEVLNHHWSDVNVYAVRGGSRFRLGTVTSMAKTLFKLPASLIAGRGELQLEADPIGTRHTYRSPEMMVVSGDRVEWVLENNLRLSSYRVR